MSLPRGAKLGILGTLTYLGTLLAGLDPKHAAVGIVLTLIAVMLFLNPRERLLPLLLALPFAVFITNMNYYIYSTPNIYLGHMNLFPLVMWVAGLTLSREIFLMLRPTVRFPLLTAALLYWVILFALEYVGVYWVGIVTEGGNPSFLGTGILHGTPLMHIFYPSAGPLYLILTHYASEYLRIRGYRLRWSHIPR